MTLDEFINELSRTKRRRWSRCHVNHTAVSALREGNNCPISAVANRKYRRQRWDVTDPFEAGTYLGLTPAVIRSIVSASDSSHHMLNRRLKTIRRKLLRAVGLEEGV